jgi:hypothetical protein
MHERRSRKPIAERVHVDLSDHLVVVPAAHSKSTLAKEVPYQELSVYWVGHSLMGSADPFTPGAMSVIETVGELARARGLGYRAFDHTLAGAPLSLNWQGTTEAVGMVDGKALSLIRELEQHGDSYDVLILTESIGLQRSPHLERSAYYGRHFYCAAKRARREGRVFFYPTWHHFYASDPDMEYPPRSRWNWRGRLDEDRPLWRALARGIEQDAEGLDECETGAPVVTLPVDDALAALSDTLARSPEASSGMRIEEFFVNPLRPGERVDADVLGKPVHADEPIDDIHASGLGDYLVSLVVFCALYEQSPIGLPALNGVEETRARALHQIVANVLAKQEAELQRGRDYATPHSAKTEGDKLNGRAGQLRGINLGQQAD